MPSAQLLICCEVDRRLRATPLACTILERPTVIYRGESSAIFALDDRVPAPLRTVKPVPTSGDRMVCGCHGLEFDTSGRCVHNTHDAGALPAALSVGACPLIERHGMAWIWMGDANAADPDLMPALPVLEDPGLS